MLSQNHKLIADIDHAHQWTHDAMHNPSNPFRVAISPASEYKNPKSLIRVYQETEEIPAVKNLSLPDTSEYAYKVFPMKMKSLAWGVSASEQAHAFKIRHNMRMLVKDTRSQDGKDDKDNDKGSKSRSQSMKEQAYNKEQRERPRPHELNDKSNLIDLMKECHQ
ncbi:hypothetical protein Tco_1070560 [Tanacetum coccineum]|uniref:Uncharacterized protein n=1 Tax=Tanacetum coccineum TaxID=301880 RepID=A0ABQ5HLW9_9ASTR